jgi:hypothetical protein
VAGNVEQKNVPIYLEGFNPVYIVLGLLRRRSGSG